MQVRATLDPSRATPHIRSHGHVRVRTATPFSSMASSRTADNMSGTVVRQAAYSRPETPISFSNSPTTPAPKTLASSPVTPASKPAINPRMQGSSTRPGPLIKSRSNSLLVPAAGVTETPHFYQVGMSHVASAPRILQSSTSRKNLAEINESRSLSPVPCDPKASARRPRVLPERQASVSAPVHFKSSPLQIDALGSGRIHRSPSPRVLTTAPNVRRFFSGNRGLQTSSSPSMPSNVYTVRDMRTEVDTSFRTCPSARALREDTRVAEGISLSPKRIVSARQTPIEEIRQLQSPQRQDFPVQSPQSSRANLQAFLPSPSCASSGSPTPQPSYNSYIKPILGSTPQMIDSSPPALRPLSPWKLEPNINLGTDECHTNDDIVKMKAYACMFGTPPEERKSISSSGSNSTAAPPGGASPRANESGSFSTSRESLEPTNRSSFVTSPIVALVLTPPITPRGLLHWSPVDSTLSESSHGSALWQSERARALDAALAQESDDELNTSTTSSEITFGLSPISRSAFADLEGLSPRPILAALPLTPQRERRSTSPSLVAASRRCDDDSEPCADPELAGAAQYPSPVLPPPPYKKSSFGRQQVGGYAWQSPWSPDTPSSLDQSSSRQASSSSVRAWKSSPESVAASDLTCTESVLIEPAASDQKSRSQLSPVCWHAETDTATPTAVSQVELRPESLSTTMISPKAVARTLDLTSPEVSKLSAGLDSPRFPTSPETPSVGSDSCDISAIAEEASTDSALSPDASGKTDAKQHHPESPRAAARSRAAKRKRHGPESPNWMSCMLMVDLVRQQILGGDAVQDETLPPFPDNIRQSNHLVPRREMQVADQHQDRIPDMPNSMCDVDLSKEQAGVASAQECQDTLLVEESPIEKEYEEREVCEAVFSDDPSSPSSVESEDLYPWPPIIKGSKPGELYSLLRQNTLLHSEQCSDAEQRVETVEVHVPDFCSHSPEMGDYFKAEWKRKLYTVKVPQGYGPGDLVSIQLPCVAPLNERSKREIFRSLRHSLSWISQDHFCSASSDCRCSKCARGCSKGCCCGLCLREGKFFICDEARKINRLEEYRSMRGCQMDPSVRTIFEEEDNDSCQIDLTARTHLEEDFSVDDARRD